MIIAPNFESTREALDMAWGTTPSGRHTTPSRCRQDRLFLQIEHISSRPILDVDSENVSSVLLTWRRSNSGSCAPQSGTIFTIQSDFELKRIKRIASI